MNTQGYTVIPLLDHSINDRFLETLKKFPEITQNTTQYVLGGFSALGNPASFHNDLVRELRLQAHGPVQSVLSEFADPGQKFEQIPDRMMFRPKGQVPTAESWHRDESKLAKPGDKIFGGWLNLDSKSQYFSCCPGTHLDPEVIGNIRKVLFASPIFTDSRSYADVVREGICPPAPMKLERSNAMSTGELRSIVRQLFPEITQGTKRPREE